MKNYTRILLLSILLSPFATMAGNGIKNQNKETNYARKIVNGQVNFSNSFSAFYTEDFSGGVPSGWQQIDSAGNGKVWKHTTTGAFDNTTLDSNGTTSNNGYMIIDSDSSLSSIGGENADLITDAIDCTGKPTVVLNFNEFLTHFNDTATVWVSTDGTTWFEIHNTSAGLAQYASTPNANNVDIDITAYAANQATVYIRFNYRADYSYYWMIDDVQLYELPTTDLAVTSVLAPLTSCTLLGPTEAVSVNLYNEGGTDIFGGITVTMVADNGTPVVETIADTITVGSDYQYNFTGTVDFSAPGNHTLTVYVTLTGDTNTTNDTVNAMIFNGPHVVNYTNFYTNGFEPADDLSGYLVEDTNNDSITWELSTQFPHSGLYSAKISGTVADDWYFTTCLDMDSSIAYKLNYFSKTSSTSTQALLEILIGDIQSAGGMNQVILPANYVTNPVYSAETVVFTPSVSGTYYIGFHVSTADSLVGFWLDDINIVPDTGVGVKKVDAINVSLYPNPTSGEVFVNSKETSKNGFIVEVFSPIGQIVSKNITESLSNYKIDLKNQDSGIYIVRIISEKGISSRHISLTR